MGFELKIETDEFVKVELAKNGKKMTTVDSCQKDTVFLVIESDTFAYFTENEILILYYALKIFCFGNIDLGKNTQVWIGHTMMIDVNRFSLIFPDLYKLMLYCDHYYDQGKCKENIQKMILMISEDCAHTKIYRNPFINNNKEIIVIKSNEKKRKLIE